MTIDKQALRDIINAQVTDDSARIELHRAINAYGTDPASIPTTLEKRLDAAAQWASSFDVGPSVRSDKPMWTARVAPDRIGDARATFSRDADSPADALSLALADAAAWVKSQKDIK